jgi:hypothetical protein
MEIFEVSEPVFKSQKDNRNPDGSDNMTFSKEFGRFNQCMIASNTAIMIQNYRMLRAMGIPEKTSGDFDELAYTIAFSEFLKKEGSDFLKHRYWWAWHKDFMNKCIQSSFGPSFEYEHNTFTGSFEKMKFCLSAGFQFSIGFDMSKVVSGVAGHVVSCSGLWFDKGEVLKGQFQDPAGDANTPKSYRGIDLHEGKNVIYWNNILSKVLIKNQSSYLILKVKK